MKTPTLDPISFKWLCGGILLGLVLGACFTVLLNPILPLPSAGEGGFSAAATDELADGLNRAQHLSRQGNAEEAARILEELIDRFPSVPEPYNNLAALQAGRGELEASRELLEKALRTHEGYAAAYENLGVIYSEIARSSYGKALRLDIAPGTPQLKVVTTRTPSPSPPAFAAQESAPTLSERVEEPRGAREAPPTIDHRATAPPPPRPAEAAAGAPAATRSAQPEPPSPTKEVLQTLHAWAEAWSDRDVPRYLAFYSARFRPDDGMELAAWEEQRHQRIRHPSWIKVELRDIVATPTGPDSVQIRLVQNYSADTYKDRTRKTMTLVREEGSWRILTENTLGFVR